MTTTATLVTKFVADTNEFNNKIKSSEAAVSSLSSKISLGMVSAGIAITAVTVIVGKFLGELNESADRVSKLADNAAKIGVSVAHFQELAVAAREAGVSAESLQNVLGLMNKNLGNAALNGGKTQQALQALGLSLKDLAGKDATEKLQIIGDKLSRVKDITLETKLATDIFGKGGKDAIGLFNSNIDASIAKVRSLGITLTESQKNGLDKLSETKDLIGTIWEGFKDNVAAEVAPGFQELADRIIQGVQGMGGLKDAAKSTADFIVSAMNKMASAISYAVTAIKLAKGVLESISDSGIGKAISGGLKFVANDFKALFNSNVDGIDKLFQTYAPKDSKYSDNGPIFGSSSLKPSSANVAQGATLGLSTSNSIANQASSVDMHSFNNGLRESSDIIKEYNKTTQSTKEALEALKKTSEKTAAVLDSFHALKDELNSGSKAQTSEILRNSANDVRKPLAQPTPEFYKKFEETITSTNSKVVKENIRSLEGAIREFKKENPGYDTSGLTGAVNELKGYLASKNTPQQTVAVNIHVEKGPDFITNVTRDITFKQAVDARFDERTAKAARGL